jgi:O-antigen/teichoic acid export membrane protein
MEQKDKYLRITKQVGISYIFTFLTFAFSPILIILLTRTLPLREYGTYSLLAVMIAVLSTVLLLGLPNFMVTKLPGLKYIRKLKVTSSIIFFEIIFLILILLILFIPFIQNSIRNIIHKQLLR